MSRHSRTQDYAASIGLCLAIMAGELPAADASGKTDPWIKVTPRGATRTRDNRPYTFDPDKLVDRFKSDGVDLPADFDHGIAINAVKGIKTPAVGWATDMQARADGTYAKMDWLPDGQQAIKDRTHRYVSPTFHHDDQGNATWLHSISLVSSPALGNMPALSSVLPGSGATATALATLAATVGLPFDASPDAVLAAAGRMIADSIPRGVHEAALQVAEHAQGKLSTLSAEARTREVNDLLDTALRETRLLPFQRDQYMALCATDAGLHTVRAILSSAMPMLGPSVLDGRRPVTTDAHPDLQNPAKLAAAAATYREQQRAAGVRLSFSEAVRAVAERKT